MLAVAILSGDFESRGARATGERRPIVTVAVSVDDTTTLLRFIAADRIDVLLVALQGENSSTGRSYATGFAWWRFSTASTRRVNWRRLGLARRWSWIEPPVGRK